MKTRRQYRVKVTMGNDTKVFFFPTKREYSFLKAQVERIRARGRKAKMQVSRGRWF